MFANNSIAHLLHCWYFFFFSGKSWGSIKSPMTWQNICLLLAGHLSLWNLDAFLNKSLQKAQLFWGWIFPRESQKDNLFNLITCTGAPKSRKGRERQHFQNCSLPTWTLSSGICLHVQRRSKHPMIHWKGIYWILSLFRVLFQAPRREQWFPPHRAYSLVGKRTINTSTRKYIPWGQVVLWAELCPPPKNSYV